MNDLTVGTVVGPLTVGKVAHGGHWVARLDGRVFFVRNAVEGEVVMARVTAASRGVLFAETIEVIEASPLRIDPVCEIAHRCGGCDFQHIDAATQRELKRQVVAEQLSRMAGYEWDGVVEAVAPEIVGWRTRVRYHSDGRAWGMRPHRGSAFVELPARGCAIAAPGLERPSVVGEPGEEVLGVSSARGVTWWLPGANGVVVQEVHGRRYELDARGFWQVHSGAAEALCTAVMDGLDPREGETAFDLYCGVGLFAGALAERGVSVIGVEGARTAVPWARRNVPSATFHVGDVERVLQRLPEDVDLVVLDPPRAGAKKHVMREILERRPRAVAYVACDPAALGRDVGLALAAGWKVASVRAFDLFGMTHHVECVAILVPGDE